MGEESQKLFLPMADETGFQNGGCVLVRKQPDNKSLFFWASKAGPFSWSGKVLILTSLCWVPRIADQVPQYELSTWIFWMVLDIFPHGQPPVRNRFTNTTIPRFLSYLGMFTFFSHNVRRDDLATQFFSLGSTSTHHHSGFFVFSQMNHLNNSQT